MKKVWVQELDVRALRLALGSVLDPEMAEVFMSEPNPGLADARPEMITTGNTLGGTSAINGAVFDAPVLQASLPLCVRVSVCEDVK